MTKIPSALFENFAPNGALHAMLLFLCNEASKLGLPPSKLFDREESSLKQLLSEMDQELRKNELLQGPRVFLNKVPVGKINELSRIVVAHGGSIVPSEEAASHVIDWNEDVDGADTAADDYIRILELREGEENASALVHWWYYPDSYNEWIPSSEINANDPPDLQSLYPPTRAKYYVCCRYILDCAAFNEWGNSFDYENENEYTDENEVLDEEKTSAPGVATAKKSRGRKRFSQLASSKKEEKVTGVVVGSVAGVEKLLPDAIPKSLTSSVKTVEVGAAGAEVRAPTAGAKRKLEEEETETWARPEWYIDDKVSAFEGRLLGAVCAHEPAEYLKLRNAIVAICRQSPLNYISGTDVRRKLPGDVSKILKIHTFLSSSNVINQGAIREARTDPPSLFLSSGAVEPTVEAPTLGDDSLLALAAKHQDHSNIDWVAVAAEPSMQARKYSAADCAARFIALQLPMGGTEVDQGKSWISTLSDALAVISK
ncbi:hypothetical protein B484DRAFT_429046, partial [Ochromonadaceae sp. CCMP2298]